MEVAAFIEIDALASSCGVDPLIAARIAQETLEKVFDQLFIVHAGIEIVGNGEAVEVRVESEDEEFFDDDDAENEYWDSHDIDDDDELGELVCA